MNIFNKKSIKISIALLAGLFLVAPGLTQAKVYPKKAFLTANSIESGYTIKLKNKRLKVGIPANTIDATKAKVKIKRLYDHNLPLENNISPVYSFDINKPVAGPIWLKIKTNKTDFSNKDVYLKYWDNNAQDWVEIPHTRNKRIIKAAIHLPYAQIAVFAEEKKYDIGTATWYNWYGAASNAYPYGTKLKVTNTDNGKSCIVEVVSTGPFNHHIIDLPKEAFAEIGQVSAGIMNVKVQEYEE